MKVKGERVRIGQLSRRTGVPTHLLRYYEARQLLAPRRGTSGYREYTEDAVLTVLQIKKLLEAGLSTQEIGFILPCATGPTPDLEPCPELLETLQARLRLVDERLDTLLASRRALHQHIEATERRGLPRERKCDPAPTR